MAVYKSKTCLVCTCVFVPTAPTQKVCSVVTCRKAMQQRYEKTAEVNKKNKRFREAFCLICNEPYTCTDSKQKYCGSNPCEIERVKRKARRAEVKRLAKLRACTEENKILAQENLFVDVSRLFVSEGYKLVASEICTKADIIQVICPNKHNWIVSPKAFGLGVRCLYCYKETKKNAADAAEQFIKSLGYSWEDRNGRDRLGTRDRILYKCGVGHFNQVEYQTVKNGSRCRTCYNESLKNDFSEVKKLITDQGYTVLSDTYIDNKSKLELVCPSGHNILMPFSTFQSGSRCFECSIISRRTPFSVIQDHVTDEGYTLLSDHYEPGSKLSLICPAGHSCEIAWSAFYYADTRCRACFGSFSRSEKEIFKFISNLGLEVIENSKNIIKPYELDIYIPEHRLAIEYNGLFWHREGSGRAKDHIRHKLDLCVQENIRLITIFEDEFLERYEIVLSKIKTALGRAERKIYARKCSVQRISNDKASTFLEENHLQGAGVFRCAFGIMLEEELVGVLTMGALSRPTTIHLNEVELKRMAFLRGASVVGGASKLFKVAKHWAAENHYSAIRSYSDLRWSLYNNSVYDKLGFSVVAETRCTPHYFKGQKRYRNQSMSKTPEERLTGKTEWELRQEQGFGRIWDCGQRTYFYKL